MSLFSTCHASVLASRVAVPLARATMSTLVVVAGHRVRPYWVSGPMRIASRDQPVPATDSEAMVMLDRTVPPTFLQRSTISKVPAVRVRTKTHALTQ